MPTTRRALLAQAAALAACRAGAAVPPPPPYDALIENAFAKSDLMGLAAAVVENGKPAWSGARGMADARRAAPMTPDTVLNIASVTKTVTAAAVMRLAEQQLLTLDDDIGAHLAFTVRNPLYRDYPITIRHLLSHISSIADGSAYAASYVCGEAPSSLEDWLIGYFASGARDVFNPWPPGEKFAYSNVGFGLLGLVVESISGKPFAEFCDAEFFAPLGMSRSAIGKAKVVADQQAVDYTLAVKADVAGRVMPQRGQAPVVSRGRSYIANCIYSFPNAPDGLLRTSARDFARFLAMIAGDGSLAPLHLLQRRSVEALFTEQFARARRPPDWPAVQGLAWYAMRAADGGLIWQHSGADPGVTTLVVMHRESRSAVALFSNTAPAEDLGDLAAACLAPAARSRRPAGK